MATGTGQHSTAPHQSSKNYIVHHEFRNISLWSFTIHDKVKSLWVGKDIADRWPVGAYPAEVLESAILGETVKQEWKQKTVLGYSAWVGNELEEEADKVSHPNLVLSLTD